MFSAERLDFVKVLFIAINFVMEFFFQTTGFVKVLLLAMNFKMDSYFKRSSLVLF